jgi:hypothetical protein
MQNRNSFQTEESQSYQTSTGFRILDCRCNGLLKRLLYAENIKLKIYKTHVTIKYRIGADAFAYCRKQ